MTTTKQTNPIQKTKQFTSYLKSKLKRTPTNTALVYEDQELSYKELNERSNQLARYIRAEYKQKTKEELKPDTLIALCLGKKLGYDGVDTGCIKGWWCLCANRS